MKAVTFAHAQSNLYSLIDEVSRSRTPVTITRPNDRHVVLMRSADYTGMLETLYLLSSPKNAARLQESIEQLNGRVISQRL